jgi:hypothetical protein
VLVIGIAMLVTVLGVGSLMSARSYGRATSAAADWEEAGTLAFSATEQAVSSLTQQAAAGPTTWRSAFTSGTTASSAAVGRGTMSWALKDETDGNLSADYLRPFRVYGIGVVNAVTRVYSVQVTPAGTPMDVLRTAVHASGNVKLVTTVLAGTGPLGNVAIPTGALGVISSNATVTLPASLWANVEAAAVTGSTTTRVGTNTVPAAAKPMPATVWPTLVAHYAALATPLSVPVTSGTYKMSAFLLSPAVNTFGTTANTAGIYSLDTTAGTASSVTLTNGRILGTLVITARANSTINLTGPLTWQTPATNLPALIISGTGLTVNITGSTSWLSEATVGKNLNPAGSPYDGTTNTTATDAYPPQVQGVIYVTGSGNSVKVQNHPCLAGTLICDGTVEIDGPGSAAQGTATYANPPPGFATGNAVAEVPGTWRWDTRP